jgi:hypothetical protein
MSIQRRNFSSEGDAAVIYLPLGGTLLGGGHASPPPSNTNSKEKKPRERNPIWDICVEILGYEPVTVTEKSLWGKVVWSLQRAGATPDQIKASAAQYRKVWPNADLTITALEKHFSHFLSQVTRKASAPPPCPECGIGGGLHLEECPNKGKE